MTPSRTAVVGSALPLLILLGLTGFPAARAVVGLDGADPLAPVGAGGSGSVIARSGASPPTEPPTEAGAEEADSIARLQRSVLAGRTLAFTGTEVVSAWHAGGSTTRLLGLFQQPGGVRTVTAHGTAGGPGTVAPVPAADGLGALTERALDALARAYELRPAPPGEVAGRSADVVVATRAGREAARIWLDRETGLLLRQDVLDSTGRLQRMAAYVELHLTPTGPLAPVAAPGPTAAGPTAAGPTAAGPTAPGLTTPGLVAPGLTTPGLVAPGLTAPGLAAPGLTVPAGSGGPRPAVRRGPAGDLMTPADLATLRTHGWPCPAELPGGFVLLDARRGDGSAGHPVVHLTYGDGLSAISVFLQPGELDGDRLTGLTPRRWGEAEVHVRAGWPEVMVWQGGDTVITAVGDAEPAVLEQALRALPRQAKGGTLDFLQQRMGSAMAWFTG